MRVESSCFRGISDRGRQSGNNRREKNSQEWGCLPGSHQLEVIFSHLNPERLVKLKSPQQHEKRDLFAERKRECLYPGRSDTFGGSRAMWIGKLANRGSHRSCHWRG